MCSSACGKPKLLTVVIERAEVQERVEAKFPAQMEKYLVHVVLDDPQVLLANGSDRLGLVVRARIKAPFLKEQTGRVGATGKLLYVPEQKAFYLAEPAIERVEVPGLSPEQLAKARGPIEAVARATLDHFPVYELSSRNLKELTARHVLHSVRVRNGQLHAELGLPL